jgi:hypothetical protein
VSCPVLYCDLESAVGASSTRTSIGVSDSARRQQGSLVAFGTFGGLGRGLAAEGATSCDPRVLVSIKLGTARGGGQSDPSQQLKSSCRARNAESARYRALGSPRTSYQIATRCGAVLNPSSGHEQHPVAAVSQLICIVHTVWMM